jgi:Raf kinase inhibitor-like YbhB/YbcL family protein
LIVDDPDAPGGVFTHWVLFNLPATTHSLQQDQPQSRRLPNGATQGRNDFGRTGYGGPCPPRGQTHRYRFSLYALGTALRLGPGASRLQVLQAIRGHVLGEAQLVGRYKRS